MPPLPLDEALAEVRAVLVDPDRLVRAVGAGRRRGTTPAWRRVELRPVRLKAGRVLQVVRYDDRQAHTANYAYGAEADAAVDDLLAQPFGSWHVDAVDATAQLRVTKSGGAQVHRAARLAGAEFAHDRRRAHLLPPDDPLFGVLGAGADKRRQVDAFLRAAQPALDGLPPDRPVRLVDLGCGNAYLTFAAHRWLAGSGRPVTVVGVDVRESARRHNTDLAARLDVASSVSFVAGTILDAPLEGADVVVALHACDTATDEALARAVRWSAPVVLAAPCCHHDVQRQLAGSAAPPPYRLLTRHGILRERFADVLTDALRAALLRLHGYRVDVVEFVASRHTPRNTLLRAVRTGAAPTAELRAEYDALVRDWRVRPALARLLDAS